MDMSLRIREVVIRAEIGGERDGRETHEQNGPSPETVSKSEQGIITNSFYKEDFLKVNER